MAGKRAFDTIGALILLVILSPVFMILAILVRYELGAPILFRQMRPGKYGKPFQLTKFRTMRETLDSSGRKLPDHVRLTSFGSTLRNSSLDELPELLNILKGEMSFVGPRPLLMEYLPLYNANQSRRHEVRPGITGWAQINGRNAISWEEKFSLDVWYVDHRSMWLDLKIMVLTIIQIIKRKDIAAEGYATMPIFVGSNERVGQSERDKS